MLTYSSATCACEGAFFTVVQRSVSSALHFLTVRVTGEQSKYEPSEQRCSNREQDVSGDSHPAQGLHGARLHELRGTRVPCAVFNRCPCLQQSHRKHAEDHHE